MSGKAIMGQAAPMYTEVGGGLEPPLRPDHVPFEKYADWAANFRKMPRHVQEVLFVFPPWGYYKLIQRARARKTRHSEDDEVDQEKGTDAGDLVYACDVNGPLADGKTLSVNIHNGAGPPLCFQEANVADVLPITQAEYYQIRPKRAGVKQFVSSA